MNIYLFYFQNLVEQKKKAGSIKSVWEFVPIYSILSATSSYV